MVGEIKYKNLAPFILPTQEKQLTEPQKGGGCQLKHNMYYMAQAKPL